MCFIGESDWTASVVDRYETTSTKPIRCDECRALIEVGQSYHYVHMEEHEECRVCEEDMCDCPEDENGEKVCLNNGCQCETTDLGESFDWRCCSQCHKFLDAIHDAEIEAGCRESESRPMLTSMVEEISEQDCKEAAKYFKVALRKYPELKMSGYLGNLWKKCFPAKE